MIKIVEELQQAKHIGIGGHIRPDGDCVGSAMGLYLFLKKALPNTEIGVYLESPSSVFQTIAGIEEIHSEITGDEPIDVFIVLDCEPDRLGFSEPLFLKANKTIHIDHHISSKGSGDVIYLKPEASSTSELIYELIDLELLDMEIAKALYIGIIHDTGVFQYSNTSKKTLETAAHLIEYSFDFPTIIEETFYQRSFKQTKLVGKAMMECEAKLDGRVMFYSISKTELEQYEADSKDLEGVVNQLRMVKGVDCAVFAYELTTGEYKISLRSNQHVNVSKIAETFGGGGHVRAAGCTVKGELSSIINDVLQQIKNQFE